MPELTDGTLFEEAEEAREAPVLDTVTGERTVSDGQPVAMLRAVIADSQAQKPNPTQFALHMDLQLVSSRREWCRRFQEASPEERSILLVRFLEDFADGVEGISVSFSEPKYHES